LAQSVLPESATPGKTWLASIGKFLPDSWSDESLISDKAAKADGSSVPVHLRDKRSTLVLLQLNKPALAGFRLLALIWQRKYMHRQLRSYLREKFGSDWLPRLLRVRAYSTRLVNAALAAKRVEKEGDGVIPPPRKGLRAGRLVFSPSTAPPSRTEMLLHLDSDACCQVLNRYFGGQWWDWKAGSSLAFWRWNREEQISDARDGMRVYIKDTLPENRVPQQPPKSSDLRLMVANLDKVLE
jgi:hypothetical protein